MLVTNADDETLWAVLQHLARGDADEAAFELARLVVTESKAERAFVAGSSTFGADADGLPLTHPEQRLDASLIDRARKSGRLHESDVAFRASRGSRLVVVGARGVIVCEHRYQPGAFDRLDAQLLDRWTTLVDLVFRAPARRAKPSPSEARAEVSAALRKTGGNITHAAALLNLSRLGLKKRMVRLGLREGSS